MRAEVPDDDQELDDEGFEAACTGLGRREYRDEEAATAEDRDVLREEHEKTREELRETRARRNGGDAGGTGRDTARNCARLVRR